MSLPLLPKDCVYTSCYCEENVWQLCRFVKENYSENLAECYAVFVSNPQQSIPLLNQKAGHSNRHGFVVWDYHVIFIQKTPVGGSFVYDLDSLLSFPCHFEEYCAKTVCDDDSLLPEFQRLFRVVPAAKFLEEFASDRKHMKSKDGKSWMKPPPNYPPISTAKSVHNLDQFISMVEIDDAAAGQVMTCSHFIDEFWGVTPTHTCLLPLPPFPHLQFLINK